MARAFGLMSLAFLFVLGFAADALAADVVCPGSPTDTSCPAQTSTFHEIRFRNLGGVYANLTGTDTVTLGRLANSGNVLAACVNGQTFFGVDMYVDPNTLITTLGASTFACLGAGHDTVDVVESGATYTCADNVVFSGFTYGGYRLYQYGQDGDDDMSGGSGADAICGGADDDKLGDGTGGSDWMYGRGERDIINTTTGFDYSYGGAGRDRVVDRTSEGYNDLLYGESGTLDCVANLGVTSWVNMSCGPAGESPDYFGWPSGLSGAPTGCEHEASCDFI